MVRFTKIIRGFIANYEREYAATAKSASYLESLLKSFMKDTSVDIHLVASRAKDPDSLRAKLRRKSYTNPESQMTDRIGVRIITYYRDDVDRVVERLRREFEIDPANSVDKRQLLDLGAFGYRSVHLVARLKPPRTEMPEYESIKALWFEIQIRSVLEHAWAEIEHEIVYKSGVTYPPALLRKFAALAGTLEILDAEFLALRAARLELVEEYRRRYDRLLDGSEPLDAARLMGFLEARWPDGLSWRRAAATGRAFPMHIEASCVDALRAVGLKTASDLRLWMARSSYRSAMRDFASLKGIAPDDISHLALVVIAVALKDEAVLRTYFPEMLRDPSIEQLIASRPRLPRRKKRLTKLQVVAGDNGLAVKSRRPA